MQHSAQPCVCAIGHGSSRTGWFFVFPCFWLHAETAVVQDLCLVKGDTKIEICRGKWGFFLHILLVSWPHDWCNIEMQNNATLAWWLIMRTSRKRCRCRVELAGWWSWGCFFFFLKFCVFLSRSLIDFSHPCNKKQRKNTLWPNLWETCRGINGQCGPGMVK